VHRYHRVWLQLEDNLGGYGGINRRTTAYREKQDVNATYFLYLLGRQHMPEVAQVTDRNTVDFHNVYSILAPDLTPLVVMKRSNTDNQDTANFIFPGTLDYPGLSPDTLHIGMRGMLMAQGDNVSGLFSQCIAKLRGEGVGDNNGLTAFNPEARVT